VNLNGGFGCSYLYDFQSGAVFSCTTPRGSGSNPPCWSVQALPLCSVSPITPNCMTLGKAANTPRFCGGAGPACSLCREEGPLQRQFGAFCLWRPKTVSPERGKERPETRFACDRDRFAAKSFARNWGHDGHAIVDAHAIAGLPLESVRAAAWVRLTAAKGLEGRTLANCVQNRRISVSPVKFWSLEDERLIVIVLSG
jgi:hypothetical protein